MTTERRGTTISAGRATSVGLASLLSAVSGWVALVVAARVLDEAANARFLLYWSLLFWLFGSLGGIHNETTRAARSAAALRGAVAAPERGTESGSRPVGARVLPLALAIGAAAALLVAATSPLWGERLLGPDWPRLVAVVCVGAIAFAGHLALSGAMAGQGAWNGYATLVAAESTTRLVLVAAAGAAGAGAFGLEAGVALAAGAWLLLLAVDRRVRAAVPSRADVAARPFLAQVGHAIVATAASSALVVGFTVLLGATTGEAEFDSAAKFILAIAVTRAPLLIPLNAYQGVAIAWFLDHRAEGLRPIRRLAAVVLGAGLVATAGAAAVGPWLMAAVFGPGYRVPADQLAALTVAAALLGLITVTGAAVLAVGAHRAYATGWAVATLVSIAVLLLPWPLEVRAVASLALGPLVGVVIHAAALTGASRRGR